MRLREFDSHTPPYCGFFRPSGTFTFKVCWIQPTCKDEMCLLYLHGMELMCLSRAGTVYNQFHQGAYISSSMMKHLYWLSCPLSFPLRVSGKEGWCNRSHHRLIQLKNLTGPRNNVGLCFHTYHLEG